MHDPAALGRVFGLVWNCHFYSGSGSARLVYESDTAAPETYTARWRSASVWHVEDAEGHVSVSDGLETQQLRKGVAGSRTPTRAGHPPYSLMTVMPLRAPIWGRLGDDYYPESSRAASTDAVVTLVGLEDARLGEMVVDLSHGYIRELTTSHWRWTVLTYETGPQDDTWFNTDLR